ncbi:hypothetical protein G6F24_017170 [Rhizopus arrhizus]|nr:hypothetical protein G6F24_017170 [Rhizopus arrhizus]
MDKLGSSNPAAASIKQQLESAKSQWAAIPDKTQLAAQCKQSSDLGLPPWQPGFLLCFDGRSPHAARPLFCPFVLQRGARSTTLEASRTPRGRYEQSHPVDGRHPEEHLRPDRPQPRCRRGKERARNDGAGDHQDGSGHARRV